MYIQSWDTDTPLLEIDVYAYVALACCCGDIETPPKDEKYERCKQFIHETMETPDCQNKSDPGETVVLYQLKRTVNISLKKTKYLY